MEHWTNYQSLGEFIKLYLRVRLPFESLISSGVLIKIELRVWIVSRKIRIKRLHYDNSKKEFPSYVLYES